MNFPDHQKVSGSSPSPLSEHRITQRSSSHPSFPTAASSQHTHTHLCGDFSDAQVSEVPVHSPDVQGLDDLLGGAGPVGGHKQLDGVLLLLREREKERRKNQHQAGIGGEGWKQPYIQRCCHTLPKPQKKTDVQPGTGGPGRGGGGGGGRVPH